jgi:RNase H-fold protein (predicted Holliday junction resolvase)
MNATKSVIAVDPGSVKCGLAIVSNPPRQTISRRVVKTAQLADAIEEMLRDHSEIDTIIIGDGTRCGSCILAINERFSPMTVVRVDEKGTTLAARERYCREIPAKGWRRLLPKGLRVPEVPIDDFVAVILAERWLENQAHSS